MENKPYYSVYENSELRIVGESFDSSSIYLNVNFNFAEQVPDNGAEFTKRLGHTASPTPTLFEARLKQCGIRHKLIRPYTPRHNGKVERSHRKDNEYFYATHTFYSFDDFKKQLAVHSRKYNNFPMRPLNWKTPAEYVKAYIHNGVVF